MPQSVPILGVNISAVTYTQTIAQVQKWIKEKQAAYICAVNVHSIMEAQRSSGFKTQLNQAGLRTPDGMPLVWLLKLGGFAQAERVYGPTLMLKLCELAEKQGYKVFVLGGRDEAQSQAFCAKLQELFPRLRIVGCYPAVTRPLSPEFSRAMVQQMNQSKADLIFLGLGCPHQEKWMSDHQPQLKQGVMVGVGAAINFLTGQVKQAPAWMQNAGLEWFFRLMQEPQRLWYRYTVLNAQFIVLEGAELLSRWVGVFSNKIRKNTLQLMMLGISVFASLVLGEVLLQTVNYPYVNCKNIIQVEETAFGHFDPLTGWSYNPLVSYYRDGVVYHFDKYGYRTTFPLREMDYSKPRILFIGDSVTFGYGLNYEDTYVAKIGKLFGDKFEIVNIGVQGYGTDQSLLRMRGYINTIKPVVVIYTFIPDHLNRNINADRREFFNCIAFPGTKPLFTLTNKPQEYGLQEVRFPVELQKHDQFKLGLLVSNLFDKWRETQWQQHHQDLAITKALVKEIQFESIKAGAVPYYIYYDNTYDPRPNSYNDQVLKAVFLNQGLRVSPTLNFAVDPHGDYFAPGSTFHPGATISSLIAKQFYQKFGSEILPLATASATTQK